MTWLVTQNDWQSGNHGKSFYIHLYSIPSLPAPSHCPICPLFNKALRYGAARGDITTPVAIWVCFFPPIEKCLINHNGFPIAQCCSLENMFEIKENIYGNMCEKQHKSFSFTNIISIDFELFFRICDWNYTTQKDSWRHVG